MEGTKVIYEGENGTETYVGDFRTEDMDDTMTGFVAIDDSPKGVTDPDDKTLKLIPRSRIYSIENITYADDDPKPTLTGKHQ